MRHPQRAILLASALIMACAAATPAQSVMSYRFKEGDKLHYVLEQKTKSLMSLAGTDIEMKVNATLNMIWQVLKVDASGQAQVKVKVINSKMSMDSLLGTVEVDSKDKDGPSDLAGKMVAQMNRAIAAMEITATMLPTGEMRNVKVSDETVKAMQAIPGSDKLGDLAHPDNFKDMISGIVFPTAAVPKGKSWTYKSESKSPSGKIVTDNVCMMEGTIQQGGVTLTKISLSPVSKVEPDAKAQVKLKSVRGTGTILFDNHAGRVVESTTQQTKQGQINVMGLVLDQVTEESTTIRLQKTTAEAVGAVTSSGARVVSVKLGEDDIVEKEVFKELLETLPGVARSFTVERGYEQAVTLTGAADAAAAAEIKTLVEASLGEKLGKRVTVKESVALDGKEITKVNVHWVERSRRGIATRSDGSTVPFLLKIGLRLKLEKAK